MEVAPSKFPLAFSMSDLQIHSVFSLLGLRRAYVTKLGRLVGVVALKEVRACLLSFNALANRSEGIASFEIPKV